MIAALLKAVEAESAEQKEFITFRVVEQLFGIPVLQVREVMHAPCIARIPLTIPEIAGSINLRGRIVTAMDLRLRLGLSPRARPGMSVVVEDHGELYSLIVDQVGDVISLNPDDCGKNPSTLNSRWQEVAAGIFSLEGELLIILDVGQLLQLTSPADPA